jgi:hypothetical protein
MEMREFLIFKLNWSPSDFFTIIYSNNIYK